MAEKDRPSAKPIKRYEDILVYQKCYQLALEAHRLTINFPNFEKYELGRQLRTSSTSIAVNIAEGFSRRSSSADFKRFLAMASGSCGEAKVWISFAKDLDYVTAEKASEFLQRFDEVGKYCTHCTGIGGSVTKPDFCLTSNFCPLPSGLLVRQLDE